MHLLACFGSVLSLFISLVWYYSLPITILSANNAIYQTTPLFVFLLSVIFLKQKVTIYKLLGLLFCAFGVILVSYFTHNQVRKNGYVQKSEIIGYVFVLISAFSLAVFEVLFDYFNHSKQNEKSYRPLKESNEQAESSKEKDPLLSLKFLGLLGFYNIVLLFPGIFIFETYTTPSHETLKSITILATLEVLYNMALFTGIGLSSSVYMAVGQILIIPVGYAAEIIFRGQHLTDHSIENYFGVFFIILGFILLQDLKCFETENESVVTVEESNLMDR